MAPSNATKAAEKITDEQLLGRVQGLIEKSETPFITTKQADKAIDELKDDQVRRRLKSLADDDGQLAYAYPRGLVFWLPEGVEPPGEVSLDTAPEDDINWDEVDPNQIPPELLEAASKAQTEEMTIPRQIDNLGQTAMDMAMFFLALGFLGVLYEDLVLESTLSSSTQDLILLFLGIGFVGFLLGGVLVTSGKTINWVQSKLKED